MIDYQKIFIPSAPLLSDGGALRYTGSNQRFYENGTETRSKTFEFDGNDGASLYIRQNLDSGNITIAGSWRKFVFGDCAACDLSQAQYVEALEAVATGLGLPFNYIEFAHVIQIEFGASLFLPNGQSAKDYIQKVVLPVWKSRLKQSQRLENGFQAFNPSKVKIIKGYDKRTEVKRISKVRTERNLKPCDDIPECFRFELKYPRRVKPTLNIETVNDTIRFWDGLIEVWRKHGLLLDFEMNDLTGANLEGLTYEDLCVIECLQARGLDGVLSLLERDRDAGFIGRSKYYKEKKRAENLHGRAKDLSGVNLTTIFGDLVNQTANENLTHSTRAA